MEIFLLRIKIFAARIIDVSLGTFRTILVVKGKNIIGSLTAFIEVFIWFNIAREALNTDIVSIWIAISYSAGFATGTFIGGYISDKFIDSILNVQIVTSKAKIIEEELRKKNYGLTIIPLENDKKIIVISIHKKKLKKLKKALSELDTKAFITITETKTVLNGYFK